MKKLINSIILFGLVVFLGGQSCFATVSSTAVPERFPANGSSTTFNFDMRLTDPTELAVIVRADSTGVDTPLTLNVDYTLSATNNDFSSGGTLTTTTTYASGNTLILHRNALRTQEVNLIQGQALPAEATETTFDKQTMAIQDIDKDLGFYISVPFGDPTSALNLVYPSWVDRAGKNATFDAAGGVTATDQLSTGEADISAFGATLIDDATAVVAQGTLALLNGTADPNVNTLTVNTLTAADIITTGPWVDVKHPDFGATGDGSTDDTVALQAAIDYGNTNNVAVFFSPGVYKCTAPLTSGTGTNPVWFGAGVNNTQIFQDTVNTDLFQLTDIEGWHISDMMAGTTGTGSSGSVFLLTDTSRGMMEDVYMPGMGYRGISLIGCLLNTFKNVVGSVNLTQPSWSDGTEEHAWIYLDVDSGTGILSNANTFIGCTLEGGPYGWYFDDAGSIGCTIIGGVAEGHETQAIYAKAIRGLQTKGLWTEDSVASPGGSRILLDECDGCSLDMAFCNGIDLVNCEVIKITGRNIGSITIDEDCIACTVDSMRIDAEIIQNLSTSSSVTNIVRSTRPETFGTIGLYHKDHLISHGGNMEDWLSTLPLPFTNFGAVTIAKESTIKKFGSNSAHLTKDNDNAYQGLAYDVPTEFRGQWITIEAWVRIVSGSVIITWYEAGKQRPIPMTGTGEWIKHTATFFYDPADTRFILFSGSFAGATDEFYIDGIKIWAQHDPYSGTILLANGATPSVYAPGSKNNFLIGGTTTITDFVNGYIGQVITLGTTFTVDITDATNIFLSTGGTWTMTDDDTLTLIQKLDGKWYEVSRGDNGS